MTTAADFVDTPTMLRVVALWVACNLGHAARARTRQIYVDIAETDGVTLPVPADGELRAPAAAFEPTGTQEVILRALKEHGELKTDALVQLTELSKSQLFEKGRGLAQLQEVGLVAHQPRAGYYLTEAGERRAALI